MTIYSYHISVWYFILVDILFSVQRLVIPALHESSLTGFYTGRAGYRPSDICVSAPTGSGKTLAFVLPIVQVCTPVWVLTSKVMLYAAKKYIIFNSENKRLKIFTCIVVKEIVCFW